MLHVACWKPTTEHVDQTCRDPADFLLYIIVIIENSFFPVISLYMQPRNMSLSIACMQSLWWTSLITSQSEKRFLIPQAHLVPRCAVTLTDALYDTLNTYLLFKSVFFLSPHSLNQLPRYHMYANKNHYSVILLLYFWSSLPHLHSCCALKQLLGIWQTLWVTPSTLWLFCRVRVYTVLPKHVGSSINTYWISHTEDIEIWKPCVRYKHTNVSSM